ncbi:MAG: hypothetical protein WCR33_02775 [Bacilli bacterium]
MENKQEQEEKSGITIRDFAFQIKKNIIIFLVIIIVFTTAGAVYGLQFKQITYTAEATTMVSVGASSDSGSSEYSNYLYASYLTNTFKTFIVCDPVVNTALIELESKGYIGLTAANIQDNTTITTSSSDLIVIISYKADESQKAIDVVNSLVNATDEVANTIEIEDDLATLEIDETKYRYKDLAGNFVPMNMASKTSASRGAGVIIIVSFLIGLIIALLTVLIKYLSNDTYTSKKNFEDENHINVLTLIPNINKKDEQKSC